VGNNPWLDAGAEDSGSRRRQMFGAGFSNLAQAGIVFAKEKNVTLDAFAAHFDLLFV
jgi:hypothetical protein